MADLDIKVLADLVNAVKPASAALQRLATDLNNEVDGNRKQRDEEARAERIKSISTIKGLADERRRALEENKRLQQFAKSTGDVIKALQDMKDQTKATQQDLSTTFDRLNKAVKAASDTDIEAMKKSEILNAKYAEELQELTALLNKLGVTVDAEVLKPIEDLGDQAEILAKKQKQLTALVAKAAPAQAKSNKALEDSIKNTDRGLAKGRTAQDAATVALAAFGTTLSGINKQVGSVLFGGLKNVIEKIAGPLTLAAGLKNGYDAVQEGIRNGTSTATSLDGLKYIDPRGDRALINGKDFREIMNEQGALMRSLATGRAGSDAPGELATVVGQNQDQVSKTFGSDRKNQFKGINTLANTQQLTGAISDYSDFQGENNVALQKATNELNIWSALTGKSREAVSQLNNEFVNNSEIQKSTAGLSLKEGKQRVAALMKQKQDLQALGFSMEQAAQMIQESVATQNGKGALDAFKARFTDVVGANAILRDYSLTQDQQVQVAIANDKRQGGQMDESTFGQFVANLEVTNSNGEKGRVADLEQKKRSAAGGGIGTNQGDLATAFQREQLDKQTGGFASKIAGLAKTSATQVNAEGINKSAAAAGTTVAGALKAIEDGTEISGAIMDEGNNAVKNALRKLADKLQTLAAILSDPSVQVVGGAAGGIAAASSILTSGLVGGLAGALATSLPGLLRTGLSGLSTTISTSLPGLLRTGLSGLSTTISTGLAQVVSTSGMAINRAKSMAGKVLSNGGGSILQNAGKVGKVAKVASISGLVSLAADPVADYAVNKGVIDQKTGAVTKDAVAGAGIGATVGTFVFPGLGSAVGAAIGGTLGAGYGYFFDDEGESEAPKQTVETQQMTPAPPMAPPNQNTAEVQLLTQLNMKTEQLLNIEREKVRLLGEAMKMKTLDMRQMAIAS